MKIYYWSPFTSKVATIKAVINSAYGLKKLYKHDTYLINSFGEWDSYNKLIKKYNIKKIDNSFKLKSINVRGFLRSRVAYILIFIKSFFFLNKILRQNKPDYLIIHLITSLPIILFLIFNYKTKLILRVSGLPKLNFFRKILWSLASKKISFVTVPTKQTLRNLNSKNIFKKKLVYFLPDPILLNLQKIKKSKNLYGKYILNIGRLTKQKNQKLLIMSFKKISLKYKNLKLLILGEGEKLIELKNLVSKLNMTSKVFFLGHIKNPLTYVYNSLCIIVSSLWEDPGFVMIEGAAYKKTVICSNCPNGPKEFYENGKNGFLFKNNSKEGLVKSFERFINTEKKIINNKIKKNYIKSKKYSYDSHSKLLNGLLNKYEK